MARQYGDAARIEKKYSWFYEHSPTGQPLTLLLNHMDADGSPRRVGIAAAGYRTFIIERETVEAGVLVDLAVSPQHRTLFPALMLQKAMLKTGLLTRQWLYGFPNPKAAPVFQRAGYAKLGAMVRFVRVLRTAEYLAERMPKWCAAMLGPIIDVAVTVYFSGTGRRKPSLQWDDTVEAGSLKATEHAAAGPLLRGVRTPEFLDWRFNRIPGRSFSSVKVRHPEGEYEGYWVVRSARPVLEVHDCAPSLLAGPNVKEAWIALFGDARKRGFRSVSFECLAPPTFVSVLRSAGMVARDERPVFAAQRDGSSFAVAADGLYLTAADEDE